MLTINKIDDIRKQISIWKKEGFKIGFVPTMGALHVGHMSLIETAKKSCDKVIVSIFVNPIQFGPNEDYNCYPRTLDADKEICQKSGVSLIFAPDVEQMYPSFLQGEDFSFLTSIIPPELYTSKLCGKSRIGHFNGVATVVLKLFNIIQPDMAFFGQKDAQQLAIIKKCCYDLNVPVEIIGCPIIRDSDGLACSSRNTYLSIESRTRALTLHKVLTKVKQLYKSGNTNTTEVLKNALTILDKEMILDYLEAVDADSLKETSILKPNTLVAIAAKIEGVRLIDNIIL